MSTVIKYVPFKAREAPPFDVLQIIQVSTGMWGTVVAQWLRCCATNRKVAGSIPAGVSGFFNDIKNIRSQYGLESTQPLADMSTRSISWG